MAHPKRKHSNMRTRLRRSHDALKTASFSRCSQCGAEILPHRICPYCGYYRGKPAVTIRVKSKKEEK
ncbi:MAG TPA: 50S ribosomal protein L32 [Candidatus Omnitrophota bacterium]|nr:50S ribosomal protein L32 [Candidatus Omnitrophota bacterium]